MRIKWTSNQINEGVQPSNYLNSNKIVYLNSVKRETIMVL